MNKKCVHVFVIDRLAFAPLLWTWSILLIFQLCSFYDFSLFVRKIQSFFMVLIKHVDKENSSKQ